MKRETIEKIQDQLTGGNSPAPNGHNLVGALNAILNTYDDADEWNATPADEDWEDAHEDFQHLIRELANDINEIIGDDDTLEDSEGTKLADLPRPATVRDGPTAELPNRPGK